jgi:xylulose-5-phosphate/fructose-6-phosphate phosphoketolase
VVADPTLAQPTADEIEQLDAWWRANNYLTIGQIYDWAQQG